MTSLLVFLFLLLTLNTFHNVLDFTHFFSVSIVDFEQVIISWEVQIKLKIFT